MIYRAIGLMSGSSLDGLDIVFAEIHESGRKWGFDILHAECVPYTVEWQERLKNARHLSAFDYLVLHAEYGRYLGEKVNEFIEKHALHHKVQLVASHGHTVFHAPEKRMTAQLGDGAAIAAETGLQVISDLRSLDVALGGQGAPIVPIGEALLLPGFDFYLNIGGIANLTIAGRERTAFDVCPANRVLNALANDAGKAYDHNGEMAAGGNLQEHLLQQLNALSYYQLPAPKSLANEFGTETVLPVLQQSGISTSDALHTMVQHICDQIENSVQQWSEPGKEKRLLVTGGGAFNTYLLTELDKRLKALDVEIILPNETLVSGKEALIMALIGILRWRQDENVFASVTGASRSSIGGALWSGS